MEASASVAALVHDTTKLGKKAVHNFTFLSSSIPNKNPVQNNFYRSKEKITVDFSIFYPTQTNVVLSKIIGS